MNQDNNRGAACDPERAKRSAQAFREEVIYSLARLETQMETLLSGNGRITKIERRVDLHTRLIWIAIGGLAFAWALARFFFRL